MASVYISPSLQDWNVGYGMYGTEEQRMNQIADIVQYELGRHGITTWRNSPDMSLQQAVAESNRLEPDVHVALHSNASANGEARGAEIYVHRFGGEAERLARDIYGYVSDLTPTEDLGVKEGYTTFNGQGMYELRRTASPAALLEVAFHDNPEDAQFIIDNIYELGRGVARGILDYFDVDYIEDTPENMAMLMYQYNGVPLA